MKLDIADRSLALMPLEMGSASSEAIAVRGLALLETLISYFDLMWQRAVPVDVWKPGITLPNAPSLGQEDLRLLSLLAAGVKDQTIAKQLGIGLRTAERRIRRVMDELGAQPGSRLASKRPERASSSEVTKRPPAVTPGGAWHCTLRALLLLGRGAAEGPSEAGPSRA